MLFFYLDWAEMLLRGKKMDSGLVDCLFKKLNSYVKAKQKLIT